MCEPLEKQIESVCRGESHTTGTKNCLKRKVVSTESSGREVGIARVTAGDLNGHKPGRST